MSFNPFNESLFFFIKPSKLIWLMVIVPHVFASLLVISLDVFSLVLKSLFLSVIIISYLYYSQLHLYLKLKKSVKSIQLDSAKNWSITLDDHKGGQQKTALRTTQKNVSILPTSFISKHLIVMNFRDNNGSHYCSIITSDSISISNFRRLRVILKLVNLK